MIPHTQKHGVRHQNQVSGMIRSRVTKLLLEVVLDLLQALLLILNVQVNLGLLKMVPNDFSYPKTWG